MVTSTRPETVPDRSSGLPERDRHPSRRDLEAGEFADQVLKQLGCGPVKIEVEIFIRAVKAGIGKVETE